MLTLIAIAFAAGALILGWRRHRSNWVAACLVLGIMGLLVSRGLESGSPHHDHHGDHHLSETESPAALESTVHPISTVPFEGTVPPRDTAPPRNTAPPENRLAATPKEHHTEHTTHSRASVAIHDHDSHLAGTAVGVLAGMILLLGHVLQHPPYPSLLRRGCMSLDWLIIGGGIHGVHIAARLLGEAGVAPERLRIVDPADRLLARWRTCTATTGMTHLRSPSVHNLDLKPFSLEHFAGKRRSRKHGLFAPPYQRPALGLFNDHCDQVVETFGLSDLHVQNRAMTCSVDCDSAGVRLSDGRELEAQNLVLAIGSNEQTEWPDWAPRGDARVQHVFEQGFDGWPQSRPTESRQTVVVVGGGISAGQIALRLLGEGHRVHLISRHALRQHQFDSDPGWLGPKYMESFSREGDYDRRRTLIAKARHQGSVPPFLWRRLRGAMARGELGWHEAEIEALYLGQDGLELRLSTDVVLEAQRVLLATGFAPSRPGGSMVDELIASASLPCASCGYPILDTALRWHPRIHVSGPLAELELGPTSRNISGARKAGDRLAGAAHSKRPADRGELHC